MEYLRTGGSERRGSFRRAWLRIWARLQVHIVNCARGVNKWLIYSCGKEVDVAMDWWTAYDEWGRVRNRELLFGAYIPFQLGKPMIKQTRIIARILVQLGQMNLSSEDLQFRKDHPCSTILATFHIQWGLRSLGEDPRISTCPCEDPQIRRILARIIIFQGSSRGSIFSKDWEASASFQAVIIIFFFSGGSTLLYIRFLLNFPSTIMIQPNLYFISFDF
jgi:hypothetical protein